MANKAEFKMTQIRRKNERVEKQKIIEGNRKQSFKTVHRSKLTTVMTATSLLVDASPCQKAAIAGVSEGKKQGLITGCVRTYFSTKTHIGWP